MKHLWLTPLLVIFMQATGWAQPAPEGSSEQAADSQIGEDGAGTVAIESSDDPRQVATDRAVEQIRALDDEARAQALVEGEPTPAMPLVVRVLDDDLPAARREVEVTVMRGSHEVLLTEQAETNADGEAHFELELVVGAEAFVELVPSPDLGDSRVFSDAIPLSGTDEQHVELNVQHTTADPHFVFVERMITLVAASEGFLEFQHVYMFATDNGQTYETDAGVPGSLLRIELPEGANRVQVQAPGAEAQHLDDFVHFAGRVLPAGSRSEMRPDLIVSYNVRHNNARSFTLEHPLSLDVQNASIVVRQTTQFERYPTLDVDLIVPICGEGSDDGLMCFAEITDEVTGVPMLDGQDVLVARGGVGSSGDVMRYTTVGWPSPFPVRVLIAASAVVISLLLGLLLIARELRRESGAEDQAERAIAGLLAQRDEIFAEAAALEEAFDEGELLERDYDRAREGLRQQLGVVFRRLRELGALDPESQSAEGVASAESGD